MERDTQFGEEWEDKEIELVEIIALSPDGKKVATGSPDGAVKLWSIDTGKVVKTLTGQTKKVGSLCWSSDGGRVVSGSFDGEFRVWDVEGGETIVGPIKGGGWMFAVCYSPDGKMIATGTGGKALEGEYWCLEWTSDGRALFAAGSDLIKKFDTVTWTAVIDMREIFFKTISISPNQRILARTSFFDETAVQLWNFETDQPIGTPLHHEPRVKLKSATFSADGKFLVTRCDYDHIYIWDVLAILKEAGLPSDNVVLCTIPPSHLDSKYSMWYDMQAVLDADACRIKPRNYHARGKTPGSNRPPNTYVIPTGTLQGTASSSQQPLATATTPKALPTAAATAVATGASSHPDIIITHAGWWTRFLLWICCVSFQHTAYGQR